MDKPYCVIFGFNVSKTFQLQGRKKKILSTSLTVRKKQKLLLRSEEESFRLTVKAMQLRMNLSQVSLIVSSIGRFHTGRHDNDTVPSSTRLIVQPFYPYCHGNDMTVSRLMRTHLMFAVVEDSWIQHRGLYLLYILDLRLKRRSRNRQGSIDPIRYLVISYRDKPKTFFNIFVWVTVRKPLTIY